MPDTDLKPFSVTDGKISNQAKINPKKIAPADQSSVLIAQSDRKYQPKTIYGDATLAADGKLTLSESATAATTITTVVPETIPEGTVKVGSSFVPVSTKGAAGTIPIRTGTGKLEADTLGGKDLQYVLDASSANTGDPVVISTENGGIAGTSTPMPHKIVVANNSYSTSPTSYVVEHDLGYEPQVTVLADTDNCGDYYEIEAQVKTETDKVTVDVSTHSVPLKIICS